MPHRKHIRRRSLQPWILVAFGVAAATAVVAFAVNRPPSTEPADVSLPSSLAVTAAPGLAAQSDTTPAAPGGSPAAASGASQTAPAGSPRAQAGQTYFIDPDTGLPRQPTPEEVQQLLASAGITAGAAAEPQPVVGENGTPGLRLTDEQMTFTVATRHADGTVSIAHASGKTEAMKTLAAKPVGGVTAQKEQER